MNKGNGKKELNFEIDLLPFISVLSCCICFLLVTAVWTHIGSLNVSQGLGQESDKKSDQANSSLWVIIEGDGSVELSVKDAPQMPAAFNKINVHAKSGRVDFAQIEKIAAQINTRLPELKTALVMPKGQVAYGDVITLMDRLKKHKISEVGIAPL